jgi:autophagy-related protein 18
MSELLFIDFNQDKTSLSVGTRNGYKLFSLISDKPELIFEKDGGEVCIVQRLFSSSLVAIVESCNPRKLRLCHFKVCAFCKIIHICSLYLYSLSIFSLQKQSEICTYSYPDTILSVHLNRQVTPADICNTIDFLSHDIFAEINSSFETELIYTQH